MELQPNEAYPSDGAIKSETRRTASCSVVQRDCTKLVASVVKSERHLNCEAMDTNNNNNTGDGDKDAATPNRGGMRAPSSSSNRIKADPLMSTAGSGQHSSSGRVRSFGPSPHGFISPYDFPSICGTPTSVSQLFNLPSSAFSLDGIEFPSPLGSGHLSPLTSARLGRKRALSSISPLSSSSLDLNNLIRTSPTSLVNYITTSRGSSAGSMGHLSPALFANPALFQPPYTRPLFSLRNAAYPQMTSLALNSSEVATGGGAKSTHNESVVRIKTEGGAEKNVPRSHGETTAATMLDIVREEGASSEDEGMATDQADYSSAITENESELEVKPGIVKQEKSQRIYYSYPSVEEPHNNRCRWSECDRQCENLEDLVRHVNTDHIYRDSRKDFVCFWSGCVREKRPFKAQYMLLVHMRRHTGEKPHRCTYEGCNKAYSRLENLKTHLRSHTGERPYVCKYEGCGKAFSNASDCAKHMNRTHSDEKPYACPNPGCMKRYTDPSSRRKHMKNCTANKRARTDDRDAMSGADEESCAETSSTKSSSSSKKTTKPKKSERKKPISFAPKLHLSGDPGYVSGGSQGYVSSQTAGYNSSGYETEYPSFHGGEEEITRILQQQTLSDPLEPCSLTYPPPTRGQFPYLTNQKPPSSHMTDHMTPNVKASRQKGGGLRMPAGRNPPPPPQQLFPPHPFQFPPSFPSYQSSQSGFSSFQEPHPPSVMPQGMDANIENNPPINTHPPNKDYLIARMSRNPSETASSGYSSFRSYSPGKPVGGIRRSPPCDDDGSSSHGVRSSLQSTSYSTFSSNSSRLSSPCSNSGRSDTLRPHPPQSPMIAQFMNPKQVGRGGESSYPLRYSLQMKPSAYMRRFSEDVNSERSWRTYSSHSSRHSYSGSELTDDLLDNLPMGSRRHSFTKTQPLPLPESMQEQFSNGGSMEYQQSSSGGDNAYTQIGVHEPTSHLQSTLPLHHFDSNDETFADHVSGHLYSQGVISQGYDTLHTSYFDNSASNMAVGDMASFASTLPEETQFLENFLSSQVK